MEVLIIQVIRTYKNNRDDLWMAELAVVAMKRVMTVEQRAGRLIKREGETMSIHSYDGKSWLTKLERISELAASNKEMVFNNIGHHIDISLLKEMYRRLNRNKAVGTDGMTKKCYGANLENNLKELLQRIRRNTYRPKPSRLVEIPKDDGSTRPLAISCIEDKIVQSAVYEILGKIYEPTFLPGSYGFRPNRNCHDALKALNQSVYRFWDGAIVEIDLCKCFNTIPHDRLVNCLEKRVADKRFIGLIKNLLKTPILESKKTIPNESGCPQGSVLSPLLANIYLHEVIDAWFAKIRIDHFSGKAEMVRYCDDMVFIFQNKSDAEKFYRVLPKRLEKYGLELHAKKSSLIESGHTAAKRAHKAGKRLPTYQFLGFLCYFGKSRNGYWRLKYASRRDRFTAKLKGLRKYLKSQLNASNTNEVLEMVIKVLRGWINYHGISDNGRRVSSFIDISKSILYKWFNRRGRKNRISWKIFERILVRVNFPVTWKTVSMFQNS